MVARAFRVKICPKDTVNKVLEITSTTGPSSYSQSSRPTITFSNLKNILSTSDVQLYCHEGFVIKPLSISGNVVTFGIYKYIGTASGTDVVITGVSEVANGTNTSGITIYGHAYGIN